MDQVNAMQQYITKLKQALSDQLKQCKELQCKYDEEHNQVKSLEEKLEYTEKKLSKEKEQVETLELKIDEYEKKLKGIQDNKKPSFLGKMFNNGQIDQYILKIKDLEHSLDLQTTETENLHAQIFSYKTQLQLTENKLEDEQKLYQQKLSKLKQFCQQEKQQKEELEKQIQQLNIVQSGLSYEISQLNKQIQTLKSDIEKQQSEYNFLQQLNEKNQDDLKKMTNDLITRQQDIRILEQEKNNFQLFLEELQNYITGLSLDSNYQELCRSLQDIIQKIHQQTIIKELFLQANPGNYQMFKLCQEKILKLGKKNEQLIKQNKQLQDRLQVQKSKQE